jgi:hypothetical protein
MSPTSRPYARIYCDAEERNRWVSFARGSKYKTFNNLARTAINLLIRFPDLPERILELETIPKDEREKILEQRLNNLQQQVVHLLKRESPEVDIEDAFFEPPKPPKEEE